MLVASMAVTVMTGFVTQVWNSRGRNLQQGISDLLKMIDPQFGETVAGEIAKAILTHPLIRDKAGRMGTIVHREELTKLLLDLAAGNGSQRLPDGLRARLAATLAEHGIPDPQKTIDAIQSTALAIEKSNPALSNTCRADLAILQVAESRFVAKINFWFDQTMDRVSLRFTSHARTVTLVCGLLLATTLQLDSIALVNRLSVDDELRASLAQQANAIAAKIDPNAPAAGIDVYAPIINEGVVPLPNYPRDFARFADFRHLAGILFTTLLLSLGAPFWYGALQQLLQFRSKLAQDDEQQRQARQSGQSPTSSSS